MAATRTHSWRSLRLMEAGDCAGICRHPLPEDVSGGWQKQVWEPWLLKEFPNGSFGLAASGFGDPGSHLPDSGTVIRGCLRDWRTTQSRSSFEWAPTWEPRHLHFTPSPDGDYFP